MGKTLGDMSPEERNTVVNRALDRFQKELEASAEAIGKVLDSVDTMPDEPKFHPIALDTGPTAALLCAILNQDQAVTSAVNDGSRITVTLADSTEIWLSVDAASRLT